MNHLTEAHRLADLLNTEDLRRPDRREPPFSPDDFLATPNALSAWLEGRDLGGGATDADLRLARRLRSGLRAIVLRGNGLLTARDELNALTRDLPLVMEFDGDGRPRLVPLASGVRSGLGRLLVDALRLGESGNWPRLKVCAAEDCGWAFVDHSRPGTARWCSSRACGNRDKTRRYQAHRRNRPARPVSPSSCVALTFPRA